MRTALLLALFIAFGSGQGSGQTADTPAPAVAAYAAYRIDPHMSAADSRKLLQQANEAGLTPVQDPALEREGLMVFEAAEQSMVERSRPLFAGLVQVPIQEFQGVLSVPTGNFYLRFKEAISPATARARVEALGFKVLTPAADRSSVLVVEGTGRPTDRGRELVRLKQLRDLLFVAPNDIPLAVSSQKAP